MLQTRTLIKKVAGLWRWMVVGPSGAVLGSGSSMTQEGAVMEAKQCRIDNGMQSQK